MKSEGPFIRDVGNEGSKIGQKLLMDKSKKLLTCVMGVSFMDRP